MINTNINNLKKTKNVLVAPLDWGLGHATRCVPIINELIIQGYKVFIAGEKAVASLLKKEFLNIEIIPLKGYNVSYNKGKQSFWLKMFAQIPKILAAINYENKWLETIIDIYKIDAVIADNRFGLYNKNVKTIFITHQLNIQTGNIFANKIAQKINYKYIHKFSECWVPDEAGENNLAGILSHPSSLPNTVVKYIGSLSRFTKLVVEKTNDVAIVLSGPEPQRTVFENIILQQIKKSKLNIVIARGLPNTDVPINIENESVRIVNHLSANDLNILIQSSKIVIARSGYSTVMDLAALQQKAIFVPTPGQTEQEYLAKYLSEKKYCIAVTQDQFEVDREIERINSANLNSFPLFDNNLLKNAISSL
jgi:uncharacterized protein (TIGR00661 family)